MNCVQCLPEKVKATQLFEWIVSPSDNVTTEGWDFGLTAREAYCDEHAMNIVRNSRKRYVITPLAGRGRSSMSEEQGKWELD